MRCSLALEEERCAANTERSKLTEETGDQSVLSINSCLCHQANMFESGKSLPRLCFINFTEKHLMSICKVFAAEAECSY